MSLVSTGIFRGFSHILAALFNNRSRFERAWRDYQPAADALKSIAGRWQGEWISETTRHRGELKCLLSRPDAEQLEAIFLAAFWRFLRVGYGVRLSATATGGGFRLKGHSDLGALAGGIYQYEGEVNLAQFNCSYRCKYDNGLFQLKRVD
jgi:hypothetical protein